MVGYALDGSRNVPNGRQRMHVQCQEFRHVHPILQDGREQTGNLSTH